MPTKSTIPLTNKLNVENGSHILYFYSSLDGYVSNAVSYVTSAFQLGQHAVLIESQERFQLVMERLREVVSEEQLDYLHHVDSMEFYRKYDDFHFDRILNNLADVVQPFLDGEISVRLWGHVDWREQDDIISKLHTYECEADISIGELGFLTVCAYDGTRVPANIQIQMMKTHGYFMTDEELVRSNLYRSNNAPTAFPSLSIQSEMETEMDLYKQKLDFVHVVSHEVRNPLTVIKAYAKVLHDSEQNESRRRKLETIADYAVVIDNEITHIINTEQMLSTDALWRKKLFLPSPVLQEVIAIMRTKARTQNIQFFDEIRLQGNEKLLGNGMGFKMIISNLLSNAIKYSDEGQQVEFRVFAAGRMMHLDVIDHGVGMHEEQLQRLFRKYEKMNDERSGQGIGLFMVKKLIDHFGGTIEVESAPGQGTTFTIKLPM